MNDDLFQCIECEEYKPVSDFSGELRTKRGHRSRCKACRHDANYSQRLSERYGITRDDYDAMLKAQNKACAICGELDPSVGAAAGATKFHVDHRHETGFVRGLLCSPCNRALGFMTDSPQRLRAAADYLERAYCAERQSAYSSTEA